LRHDELAVIQVSDDGLYRNSEFASGTYTAMAVDHLVASRRLGMTSDLNWNPLTILGKRPLEFLKISVIVVGKAIGKG
jgi:hypothetical protein